MSTLIETNTEKLEQIVNRVYNLPNIGGKSSQPDLVIGLNLTETPDYLNLSMVTAEDLAIVSGSVDAVVEKVKQGFPVKVLFNTLQWYDTYEWYRNVAEATSVGLQNVNAYPSDDYKTLAMFFNVQNLGSRMYPAAVWIRINLATGELLYLHRPYKTEL